jgi:hypothetical protein
MPIGLTECGYLFGKSSTEANDFDVTITNLAPGIFGELSKDDSKGDVF